MTEPNSVVIHPSLEVLSDRAKLARAIESHPLFKDRVAELQLAANQKAAAQIDALSVEVAQLDEQIAAIRADEAILDREATAIRDEAAQRLRALDERRMGISSKRHGATDRRRSLVRQIRGLKGEVTAAPGAVWQLATPSWFDEQVQRQKDALPSTAFPPKAREVTTYVGNTPIVSVVYDR